MSGASYEPKSRIHHCIASVGKKCYMHGETRPRHDLESPSFIEVFDQEMKTWIKEPIEISPSDLILRHTRGSCCAIPSGDIYFYGGFIGRQPCDHLYKLNTTSTQLELLRLSPGGDDKPVRKAGCQMVVFHKTKIALYGGQTHENLISTPEQLSRTVSIGRNWQITNELHVFDILTGDWSFPLMKGISLPHSSYFSFTAIDDHRALVFGGNVAGRRVDNLYLIDFNIMTVSELKRKEGQPWPTGRDAHAACCLGFGSDNPQLLIIGGIDPYDETIGDAWIFDFSSQTWRMVTIPECGVAVEERFGHSATAIQRNPFLIEVTVFGGCLDLEFIGTEAEHLLLPGTIVLKFELRPEKQWILLPVLGSVKALNLEVGFLNVVQGMIEDAVDQATKLKRIEIKEIEQEVFTSWENMTTNEKVDAIKKYSSKPHEAEHCLLTPVEYRALHTVFSAYKSKEIMDVWWSVYHLRVVTLYIITQLLQKTKLTIVAHDLKGKFDKVLQKLKAQEAYELALSNEMRLKMTYLKFIAFGLPRSGKSSTFRRLIGEIINLQQLGEISRSTGVAECRDVIIKPFKSVPAAIVGSEETPSIWESLKKTGDKKLVLKDGEIDHTYLAHLFFHIISKTTTTISDEDLIRLRIADDEEAALFPAADLPPQAPLTATPQPIPPATPAEQIFTAVSTLSIAQDAVPTSALVHVDSNHNAPTASELKAVQVAIEELSSILESDSPREFQMLLEKLIMINMMDVGGQPGFVEMLPAFTTGSALYFLFFRMDQEIHKLYPVRFLAANSVEEVVLESSYCIEDVLCQLVSSISCFESTRSVESCSEIKSRALLFGTFKDQFKCRDALESHCKEVEATLWKTLSSMQEDLLLEADKKRKFFTIDNMDGNDDIDSIRKTIEDIIRSSFSQTEVPPSWLMFRILLILVGKPVVSLSLCRALASRLEMPTPVEDAIQFFHHNIGSLMHYPEVESVKDVVICDPQVIFDSISELVIDTFGVTNRAIPRSVRKEFESKGFFTLKHIETTTQKKRKSHLTPKQLIDLLKHLGILAEVQPEQSDESTKFIIPAVLKNASEEDLTSDSPYQHFYSIMIHFDCGFVPYGVFCFVVARFISSQDTLALPWKLRKDLPIRKNRVIFLVDGRFDVILVSQPQYLEIQLGQCRNTRRKAMTITEMCPIVREQIVQTLNNVIMEMKYKLRIFASEPEKLPFFMAFPCSKKGHSGHLMKIIEEEDQPPYAQCLKDESEINLSDHNQLVWFDGKEESHDDITAGHGIIVGQLCPSNTSDVLSINHLDQVRQAIWEGRIEWRNLGLELKLSPDTLKAISKQHPQSVDECFVEMLSGWLKSGCRPTWEDMISALRSPIVGLQALAIKLEKETGKIPCDSTTSSDSLHILKDSGTLNINHLVHILHATWEGRNEWRSLGVELGIPPDTLEAISRDHPQSIKDCFLEMISEWLRNSRQLTWEDLISALKSPLVGLQTLTAELENK